MKNRDLKTMIAYAKNRWPGASGFLTVDRCPRCENKKAITFRHPALSSEKWVDKVGRYYETCTILCAGCGANETTRQWDGQPAAAGIEDDNGRS